jgi:hypothetical protein
MIGNKSGARITGILYSLMFGTTCGALAYELSPQFHPVVKYLIIGVFVIAFYCVGVWAFTRIESNKKLPTPSRELRKRNKEFYDWLDSQGRR